MSRTIRMAIASAALLVAMALSPALAQQQTQRVMGTIEGVDGRTLAVKTKEGEVKVNVTDNVAVFGVVKVTVADIKPGSFVGVGAMPQPDGSQKAIRVMIFADAQLRARMGIKIFVDAESDLRIIRRIQRDTRSRGRTVESVIEQYLKTVRPMHLEFVEPSKRYADIIIPNGGLNAIAIDMVVAKIERLLDGHV